MNPPPDGPPTEPVQDGTAAAASGSSRTPHADRPPARHLCGCAWMETTNPGDPAGSPVERRIRTDPDCPLHGPNAERSPL